MIKIFAVTLMLAACLALSPGCKDDAATKTGAGTGAATSGGSGSSGGVSRGPATSSSATREGAAMVLDMAADALDAKDYDKAVAYFHVPPGRSPEDFKKQAPALVEQQEISKEGVEVLAARGKWGTLAEVYGDRAKNLAERAGVPPEQCYGLSHEGAETAFHWSDQGFKIIRCNNVGKLKK